ncbi:hypothetical protein L195_g055268 [Trifolium pratense]|uniref:Uncharacterized protein n=1 Tax=Trifolium pratense TaxID=57577 RepID=A0A2K3KKG0_TRIPR|nr:hypothetical protein L195_g055268 [Trifolium pratense]
MAVAASTSTVLVPRLLTTTTNVTRCSALPYLPPRLSTTPSSSSSLFLKHSISGLFGLSFGLGDFSITIRAYA